MSDYELKPCPFCGATNTDVGFIGHTDDCYLMLKYMGAKKDRLIKAWNTRPIEDALTARIAELETKIAENNVESAKHSLAQYNRIAELEAEIERWKTAVIEGSAEAAYTLHDNMVRSGVILVSEAIVEQMAQIIARKILVRALKKGGEG